MNIINLEKQAQNILDKNAFDFYRSGVGDEFTLKLNQNALKRIRLKPRILCSTSNPIIKCKIFNFDELQWPFGIAPMGMQKMANSDGEIAVAKAAKESGCIFIMSTVSTTSIEELATAAPETHKWFQLYIYKDRSLTENLICRAEKAGFKAIVVTVDVPYLGMRRADIRNSFQLPVHLRLANFSGTNLETVKVEGINSGISEYVSKQFDPSLKWKDVEWLVKFTKLPVILKGILTTEDAILAVQYGCKGIIISNHGGRQLDGVPAPIEMLPQIVKAVGNQIVVMMDGGISQGIDVFKAIALGAKIVFTGRPIIWTLTVDGQKGVLNLLDKIREEFIDTMKFCGCTKLENISLNHIIHESYYAKL